MCIRDRTLPGHQTFPDRRSFREPLPRDYGTLKREKQCAAAREWQECTPHGSAMAAENKDVKFQNYPVSELKYKAPEEPTEAQHLSRETHWETSRRKLSTGELSPKSRELEKQRLERCGYVFDDSPLELLDKKALKDLSPNQLEAVSYTHLTLPTICSV